MKTWLKFWRWSFWTLLLLTLWLSLVPAEHVPAGLTFWDKAQHAAGFAALAVSGLLAYPGRNTALAVRLAGLGVGIEIAQWLSGWRQGDWLDWLADCVGILLGWLVWRLWHWLRDLRRRSMAPQPAPPSPVAQSTP